VPIRIDVRPVGNFYSNEILPLLVDFVEIIGRIKRMIQDILIVLDVATTLLLYRSLCLT
jgi:hypothetical protein